MKEFIYILLFVILVSCSSKNNEKENKIDENLDKYSLLIKISEKDTNVVIRYNSPMFNSDSSYSFLMFGKVDSLGNINNLSSDPSFLLIKNEIKIRKSVVDSLVYIEKYNVFIEEYFVAEKIGDKEYPKNSRAWGTVLKGKKILNSTFEIIKYY